MKPRKVIIVGGGPSGLMAAGRAAAAGADTLILEKMKRPGLKLDITGKGRCNVTNDAELNEFIAHFGKSGRFLRQAFARFFNTELIEFIENLGVKLAHERGGRVFPTDGKAREVTASLLKWAKNKGVRVKTESQVEELMIDDEKVIGVVVNGIEMMCDAVILATGGASYPATGSTGDGYQLAEATGHRLISVRPALVPLETEGRAAGRMAGLNLRNINVRLFVDGKKKNEAFGEIVFADYGLTGPVILTLSGGIVDLLRGDGKDHRIELALDLKPALDEKKLENRLLRDFTKRDKEPLESILRGLLPSEMIPICLEMTDIPADRPGHSVTVKERRRLRNWLKDFRLQVTGCRPLKDAIVTAGGVDTREIDPLTMESKKIDGLYMIGELLDIQADTGGYNLQAAFSTGWLAGNAAAQERDTE